MLKKLLFSSLLLFLLVRDISGTKMTFDDDGPPVCGAKPPPGRRSEAVDSNNSKSESPININANTTT
jgi:hypothetical protein